MMRLPQFKPRTIYGGTLLISLILVYVVNPQSFHWTMQLHLPWTLLVSVAAALLAAAVATALVSGRHALSGGPAETAKFYLPRITIGRGSKDFPVDLRLEGDLEISRKQATLERHDDGTFTITCEGRNPLELDGQEFLQGENRTVAAGQTIKIGNYELKIV